MSTESELAAGEFHKRARDPKFGDVMRFSVDRKNPSPDATFSQEAISNLATELGMFIAHRAFAHWQEAGEPPQKALATLSVNFDPEAAVGNEQPLPWYHLNDVAPPDGAHRRINLGES